MPNNNVYKRFLFRILMFVNPFDNVLLVTHHRVLDEMLLFILKFIYLILWLKNH